jgi:DNA-binding GntR family transcriptional regulator
VVDLAVPPARRGSVLLRDNVYSTLKAEILRCQLPPGSELREQSLAERFCVSKSPVREALLRLEREYLVDVMSRQGYRVMPISISDTQDMYTFRMLLETTCAAEAARHASDKQLKELDVFRKFIRNETLEQFITRNRDFHCSLFAASGNRRMERVARELIEQMDRVTYMSINSMRSHDTSQLVREHCAIIDALQARDGRLAAKLLRKHVSAAARRALKALKHSAITT